MNIQKILDKINLYYTDMELSDDNGVSENESMTDDADNDERSSHLDEVFEDTDTFLERETGSESDRGENSNERTVTKRKICRAKQIIITQKRLRNSKSCKDNAAKKARDTGQAGAREKNKIPSRKIKGVCPTSCRFKCKNRISESARQAIFDEFWSLNSHTRQWDYVDKSISASKPKERKIMLEDGIKPKKENTYKYHLATPTEKVHVCRTMFFNTLGISRQWIQTIKKKKGDALNGHFIIEDQRGKHQNRPSKYPLYVTEGVHEHIQMFPRVESHYCRERTNKKYLEEGLNLTAMYRMYKSFMSAKNIEKIASLSYYRRIFNTKYNLEFHVPKKDTCDECTKFKNLSAEEKNIQQKTFDEHQMNKNIIRDLMHSDKSQAAAEDCANRKLFVGSFNLPKVLTTPRSNASIMYYSGKLSIYNFTTYDMGIRAGTCNVWNETDGKGGSNEISSIVWRIIAENSKNNIEEFRFYSDNCGDQNRNKTIYTMYLKAATDFNVKITHRYFEVGHSQNDGDSMHGSIERAARNKNIFTQDQWYKTMRSAKVENPYVVHQVSQDEIFDFSALADTMHWEKIKISKLREISFEPSNQNIVKYKYRFDEPVHTEKISLKKTFLNMGKLEKAYKQKLNLSKDKIDDLKRLCENQLIPAKHHYFYNYLFHQ